MNKTNNMGRVNIRWQLLATVSALALTASAYTASEAFAADNDTDRPLIWVELGGQLSRLSDAVEPLAPSFMADVTRPKLLSALDVQQQPSNALDPEGKISFQPDGSDWIFSASVRFGRSQAIEHRHTQSKNAPIKELISIPTFGIGPETLSKYPGRYVRFADGQSQQSERHLVLDFQAGKDVGLGMFGSTGSAVLSAGLRFAQFNSKSNVSLDVVPDLQYPTHLGGPGFAGLIGLIYYVPPSFHEFSARITSERSFKGLGPALAWNASMPFAGNAESGELTFDWGVNAALLFGRQKASGQGQTTARTHQAHKWNNFDVPKYKGAFVGYFFGGSRYPAAVPHIAPNDFSRERSVAVPDLGGSVGMSFRYADAKVSFGYKADLFFNAIDGGIATRKTENRGFFGPYASISIGLGD